MMPTHSLRLSVIRAVRRWPIGAFLVVALSLGWTNMLVPLVLGARIGDLTLLGALLGGLFGGALLVSWLTGEGPAVRHLLAGAARWRIGWTRAAVCVFGIPVLTVVIAALTRTLTSPRSGWLALGSSTVVAVCSNTAVVNVWEEIAWTGFVQQRLMFRQGALRGSLLTAPPFVAIHWPLVFQEGGLHHTSMVYAGEYFTALILLAPFFRYLLGLTFLDTGGSTLAAGLMHGSLNAAGAMAVVPHAWQHIPAVVVLLALVVCHRTVRANRPSHLAADPRLPFPTSLQASKEQT